MTEDKPYTDRVIEALQDHRERFGRPVRDCVLDPLAPEGGVWFVHGETLVMHPSMLEGVHRENADDFDHRPGPAEIDRMLGVPVVRRPGFYTRMMTRSREAA